MEEIQNALKNRYPHIHPLIFHRCVEKALSDVELFDMLETIPDLPIVWDDSQRKWVNTDLFQGINLTRKLTTDSQNES